MTETEKETEKEKEKEEETKKETMSEELHTLSAIKEKTAGRILGVDFGDVRTGLALSDTGRYLASGIGYIRPGGIVKTADAVAAAAAEQKAGAIVVGYPKNMDGSEGFRAERVREFAALLRDRFAGPVVLYDERMTTLAAARFLSETNTRGQKRKAVVDTLSAQILLQNVLDRLKNLP